MARRAIGTFVILCAMTALACNLQQIGSSPVINETQPLIELISPANQSVYAAGIPVVFHAIAQSPRADVARIEFRVDGFAFDTISSDIPTGELILSAHTIWTASQAKKYLITAEAFRADGASHGVSELVITVVGKETSASGNQSQSNITPAATPTSPGSINGPDAPQAVVNVETLNIRQGPGPDYPLVGTLKRGDRVPIVGHNTDSSWWAISFGGGTAWIFSGLTTTEGNLEPLPLVAAP